MTNAFHRISPEQASDLILRSRAGTRALALFDSRDMQSYQQSHIRGADHLNESSFGEVITYLPKNVPVMIYCYHGNASQVYAHMFADFKFSEVYSVDGGHEALLPTLAELPALNVGSSQALTSFIAEYHFDEANLDSPWDFALTPLMRAALLGRDDLTEELLEHKVNIHLRNTDGNNALWLACVSGNSTIVQQLLNAGIDINNQNLTGASTLMYTASSGKAKLMQLLLAHGADPMLKNDDDFLAVDLCANAECLALLRHTAI